MYGVVTKNIVRFFVLILVQVLPLNKINFLGYLSPYLYILFILLLPFELKGWALLLLSFVTGLTVDFFSGTPGLHAAAATFAGFIRPLVIKLVGEKPEYDTTSQPGIRDMGTKWFIPYVITMVTIHHLVLNLLEVFSLNELVQTLLRTIISSIFTILSIIIVEYVFIPKKEKF
jgi:rod shape-determining protein MreD